MSLFRISSTVIKFTVAWRREGEDFKREAMKIFRSIMLLFEGNMLCFYQCVIKDFVYQVRLKYKRLIARCA